MELILDFFILNVGESEETVHLRLMVILLLVKLF